MRIPLRIPRSTGSAAGVLAVSLLLFSLVGAAWGFLRPVYSGTVIDGGRMNADPLTAGAEFVSFASFTVATGLLAVLVALSVYVLSPATRGPGMLWWLMAVAALSAFSFLQAGTVTAGLAHDVGDLSSLAVGDTVSLVPGMAPGIGWLVAPFMAALSYWCSALVTPEPDPLPTPIQ